MTHAQMSQNRMNVSGLRVGWDGTINFREPYHPLGPIFFQKASYGMGWDDPISRRALERMYERMIKLGG